MNLILAHKERLPEPVRAELEQLVASLNLALADDTTVASGAPAAATYITQTAHADLSAEQALSALTTGLVKVTTGTGVLSTATAGTDYAAVAHTHTLAQITDDGLLAAKNTIATADLDNDAVTYAKQQNVSAISKLLGRGSGAGAGDPEEITLGTNLSMSGTTLNAADTDTGITQLTGNVTAGPGNGSQVATIANDAVTYAKIQNVSAISKLLGRGSGAGVGDPEEITLGTNLSMSGTTLNATDTDTGITQLTGNVTAGPGSGSQVATIANDAVTYAKMQNVSAVSKLLGRGSAAGSGDPEEITLGTNLAMSGTTLNATDTGITQLTSDVTAGPGSGSVAATIANNAVSYAKMQDVSATARFIGRITAAAGDPEELTGTQATTLLDAFTSVLKGLVPLSGGGTVNFLRADGTWAPSTAVNVQQTEIDFGTTPVAEASFTITDAGVSAGSQIIGSVAYEAPTGKDLDELDMDGLDLKFGPGSGQFTLYARALDDALVADKFKICYLVG